MVEWTVQKMRSKNIIRLCGLVILLVGFWHIVAGAIDLPTWGAYTSLVPSIPTRAGINAENVLTMALGAAITWFV